MKRKAIHILLPIFIVLLVITAQSTLPDISSPFDPRDISPFIPEDISSPFDPGDISPFIPEDISSPFDPGNILPSIPDDISHLIPEEVSPLDPKSSRRCDSVIIQGRVTSISQSRSIAVYVDTVLQGYGLDGAYPGFSLAPGVTVETTSVYSSYPDINVGDCVEVSGKWCTYDSSPIYLGDPGTYVKKITCPNSPSNPKSESCIQSGGSVVKRMCCRSTPDFPNTCVVGACGCSPDNSKETAICDCGEGKCFDGTYCVDMQVTPPTPLCTPGPTGNCRCLNGAVWNEYQKEDCTKEWIVADDCGNRGPNWSCENLHGMYPRCECVETTKTPCDEDRCSRQRQPIGEPFFDDCGNKIQVYSVCECKNNGCDCSGREEKMTKRNNRNPDTPTITFYPYKSRGNKGVSYSFTAVSNDGDRDKITYEFSWGDGRRDLVGPVNSGKPVTASHAWRSSGNYRVKVTAIDQCNARSTGESCPYIEMVIV